MYLSSGAFFDIQNAHLASATRTTLDLSFPLEGDYYSNTEWFYHLIDRNIPDLTDISPRRLVLTGRVPGE